MCLFLPPGVQKNWMANVGIVASLSAQAQQGKLPIRIRLAF